MTTPPRGDVHPSFPSGILLSPGSNTCEAQCFFQYGGKLLPLRVIQIFLLFITIPSTPSFRLEGGAGFASKDLEKWKPSLSGCPFSLPSPTKFLKEKMVLGTWCYLPLGPDRHPDDGRSTTIVLTFPLLLLAG